MKQETEALLATGGILGFLILVLLAIIFAF